jgi:hypothetical protein
MPAKAGIQLDTGDIVKLIEEWEKADVVAKALG